MNSMKKRRNKKENRRKSKETKGISVQP